MIVHALMSLVFVAAAQGNFAFDFNNVELPEIVRQYAKATGQQFVFDDTLKGKGSLVNPSPISKEEAFNQLTEVLALNGYAWMKRDNVIVIQPARRALRGNVEVVKDLPPMRPQKMVTWVYEFNHLPAELVYRQMRVLQSNEGELNTTPGNKLIITDWISNLHRVAKLFAEVDTPENPNIASMLKEFNTTHNSINNKSSNKASRDPHSSKSKGKVKIQKDSVPAAKPPEN